MPQALARALGWSLEFRQLQAGGLTTRATLMRCGQSSLLRFSSNRRLEVAGEPQTGAPIVAMAGIGSSVWINGHSAGDAELVLLHPCSGVHALTEAKTDVFLMCLSSRWLDALDGKVVDQLTVGGGRGATPIAVSHDAANRVRRTVFSSLECEAGSERPPACASRVRAALLSAIRDPVDRQETATRSRSAEIWRTVSLAREYVDDHLTEPMRVVDICAYADVSLSKLERVFRREFQMSPSAYVVARRLAAVRRELRQAVTHRVRVGRVARHYGFRHLGRFSAAYRNQFGEAPSETRSIRQ